MITQRRISPSPEMRHDTLVYKTKSRNTRIIRVLSMWYIYNQQSWDWAHYLRASKIDLVTGQGFEGKVS